MIYYRLTLEHKPVRRSCERKIEHQKFTFLVPLHQTPSRRIALLFAARAFVSEVGLGLLAGYCIN